VEAEILEQFRALREDNQTLRKEVREDIRRLHAKLDEHNAAINARCARCGEEIAVLMSHEREREKRIDRRIALGLFLIAAVTLLLKVLP